MSKINMIRKEGGSRVMTITKVIPSKWIAVDIEIITITSNYVTLKINKVK